MTKITTGELTAMRAVADDFFPDTCTIQTRTTSTGAQGGISESYANTHVLVPCRLDPVRGDESIINNAVESGSDWILNVPYDQAISETGRVIHDSETYEVTAVWDTHSYRTIRRAQLKRVN